MKEQIWTFKKKTGSEDTHPIVVFTYQNDISAVSYLLLGCFELVFREATIVLVGKGGRFSSHCRSAVEALKPFFFFFLLWTSRHGLASCTGLFDVRAFRWCNRPSGDHIERQQPVGKSSCAVMRRWMHTRIITDGAVYSRFLFFWGWKPLVRFFMCVLYILRGHGFLLKVTHSGYLGSCVSFWHVVYWTHGLISVEQDASFDIL